MKNKYFYNYVTATPYRVAANSNVYYHFQNVFQGPITAGTLGTAVRDRSLQLMGVKNEFLGLFLSLVMGFLFGLTICAIDERYGVVEDWPTTEMISRYLNTKFCKSLYISSPFNKSWKYNTLWHCHITIF